jgi:hypothetical protein
VKRQAEPGTLAGRLCACKRERVPEEAASWSGFGRTCDKHDSDSSMEGSAAQCATAVRMSARFFSSMAITYWNLSKSDGVSGREMEVSFTPRLLAAAVMRRSALSPS